MNSMRIVKMAAAAFVALLSVAATDPHPDWTAQVAATQTGSHVLGNPAATVKLAEYISYTCPHCASFHKEADGPLRIGYVAQGKVSVEMRHLVRDPVDLAAALLANCGDKAGFFQRHNAFLRAQDDWLPRIGNAPASQRQRWSTGPVPERLRAIASDFGFYDLVEQRGISRSDANRCLGDEAMTKRLLGQTQAAIAAGVEGTPSFMLNGQLMSDVHDWDGLRGQIDKRM